LQPLPLVRARRLELLQRLGDPVAPRGSAPVSPPVLPRLPRPPVGTPLPQVAQVVREGDDAEDRNPLLHGEEFLVAATELAAEGPCAPQCTLRLLHLAVGLPVFLQEAG